MSGVKLNNLQDAWFRCHQKIIGLERNLCSPVFILYKREKARLERLIDLEKLGKVLPVTQMCYDFWHNQPISLDPVDPEFLKELEI